MELRALSWDALALDFARTELALVLVESGVVRLALFLDLLSVFTPFLPFLSPANPLLFKRPMLASVVGDQLAEPRGVGEGDMNEPKSTLESQGMFSNFHKGTPHTGTLVEIEMGSIHHHEFEIELRDRNHQARELVLRSLRRTYSADLTQGVSI
jgi:hypothetical protein